MPTIDIVFKSNNINLSEILRLDFQKRKFGMGFNLKNDLLYDLLTCNLLLHL